MTASNQAVMPTSQLFGELPFHKKINQLDISYHWWWGNTINFLLSWPLIALKLHKPEINYFTSNLWWLIIQFRCCELDSQILYLQSKRWFALGLFILVKIIVHSRLFVFTAVLPIYQSIVFSRICCSIVPLRPVSKVLHNFWCPVAYQKVSLPYY